MLPEQLARLLTTGLRLLHRTPLGFLAFVQMHSRIYRAPHRPQLDREKTLNPKP